MPSPLALTVVVAQFDDGAVRVLDVQRGGHPLGAEPLRRAVDHGERAGQRAEITRVHDQAEMVQHLMGNGPVAPVPQDQVDDRRRTHPDRRERRLPPAPLLDADGGQAERPHVPVQGSLDVTDAQHEMVEPGDPHSSHGPGW